MLSARVAPFVEFVDSPLCSLDGDGRIVALNLGFADLPGIWAEQGHAQPIDHFLSADDALGLHQRLANGGSLHAAPGHGVTTSRAATARWGCRAHDHRDHGRG